MTSGCLIATLYMYGAYSRARREMPGNTGGVLLLRPDGQAAPGHCNSHYHRLCGPADHHAGGRQGGDVPADWAAGFTQAEADSLKGCVQFCTDDFNLPYAFVSPISISILPAITAQTHPAQCRGARRTEESAIRIMGLITMPCAVGLMVLAQPIMGLLGDLGHGQGNLLAVLGVSLVFTSVVLLTNTMMQAHGFVYLPVMNMFIGGVVKVIVNYILVGNPNINIQRERRWGTPVFATCALQF